MERMVGFERKPVDRHRKAQPIRKRLGWWHGMVLLVLLDGEGGMVMLGLLGGEKWPGKGTQVFVAWVAAEALAPVTC